MASCSAVASTGASEGIREGVERGRRRGKREGGSTGEGVFFFFEAEEKKEQRGKRRLRGERGAIAAISGIFQSFSNLRGGSIEWILSFDLSCFVPWFVLCAGCWHHPEIREGSRE
jgi:hypothetical protein